MPHWWGNGLSGGREMFWKKVNGQVSNEKNPACLGYIGDEILPSYIGIIYFINHCKDPY